MPVRVDLYIKTPTDDEFSIANDKIAKFETKIKDACPDDKIVFLLAMSRHYITLVNFLLFQGDKNACQRLCMGYAALLEIGKFIKHTDELYSDFIKTKFNYVVLFLLIPVQDNFVLKIYNGSTTYESLSIPVKPSDFLEVIEEMQEYSLFDNENSLLLGLAGLINNNINYFEQLILINEALLRISDSEDTQKLKVSYQRRLSDISDFPFGLPNKFLKRNWGYNALHRSVR